MSKRTLIAAALVLAASAIRCGADSNKPPDGSTTHHAFADAPPQVLDPESGRPLDAFKGPTGTTGTTGVTGTTGHTGLTGLPPENPICVNHSGPADTCWGEWLKETGWYAFTPVARGQLGAGPWPTTPSLTLGTNVGLKPPILYVGVDTGENQYAVSAGALFIRRAGAAQFEEYDQNTSGLKNYPFLSVAGGAPGTAFVGHVGITPPSEFNVPPTDGPDLTHSGGIDRVDLTPTGIKVTPYWTHNSNSPGGSYSHDRTDYNLFVPRRGPAAGELYSSSEHCITRRTSDDYYASHRHIEVDYGGSAHYGMARAVTVTDDGTMWYGSDYEFGALAFQPRLYEWYFDNSWILPTNAFGAPEEQDWYRGIGVDANGDVWAAAHGWGLSHLSDVDLSKPHGTLETLNTPDLNMNALVVDMDNSIWIGADGGLFRYTPSTKTWTTYSEAGSGIAHVFLDDTVTPRAIYAATNGGIFVYRGP